MRRLEILVLAVAAFVAGLPVQAQTQNGAYRSYIEKYHTVAVDQMKKYGIPASITLAQGILESDAGRSMLAVEGNNHFGIKCHSDWTGATMYQDDDRSDECFRMYASAKESFEDHSLFLVGRSRYAQLFELKETDYRGWATGLKAAGYATNPQYAEKLVSLIELYGLDVYDREGTGKHTGRHGAGASGSAGGASRWKWPDGVVAGAGAVAVHQPYRTNGLLYVVMDGDETLKDIAEEFNMTKLRLRCVNDLDRSFVPDGSCMIYLQRKKSRAAREYAVHVVRPDESVWTISQYYGVRMRRLIKRNGLSDANPLAVGMSLRMR